MLLTTLALLFQLSAPADSGADVVNYGARRVIFLARTEEVLMLDSAWVRYRQMEVFADSIHYDVRRHRLSASGDVLFSSGTENITGVFLSYDLDTRKGMMRTARTAVENGFFAAREVWLVEERVLNARSGAFTTCDREHPHYDFFSPRVKLEMDDAAYSQPVLFRLGRVPVLAAPFWIVPVASKRRSGLLPFKFGFAREQGWFARNLAYYLVINDYSDITFYGDVMTKKGIQGRADAIYDVSPFARGALTAAYIREWDTGRRRYSLVGEHTSRRFLFGTEVSAKVDLVSDTSYLPEYTENRIEWLKQEAGSFISVSRRLGGFGRLTATAESYEDFIRNFRRIDLPRLSASFGTRPLAAGWTATPTLTALRRSTTRYDSTATDTARNEEQRIATSVAIAAPRYQLGNIVTLTVGNNLTAAVNSSRRSGLQSHDAGMTMPLDNSFNLYASELVAGAIDLNQELAVRHSASLLDSIGPTPGYSASIGARTNLYRVFDIRAFRLQGILHTVSPVASFTFSPKTARGGLFGRPDIRRPDAAVLALQVGNSVQGRFDSLRTKRDLGRIDFAAGYDLVHDRLSPLTASFYLTPLADPTLRLSVDGAVGFDFDSLRFRRDPTVATSFSYNRIVQTPTHPRGFELSLRHSLSGYAHMLTATASFAIAGWQLSLTDFGYNIAERQFANYGLRLWRDLHCWEAIATVQRLGRGLSWDFELRIKKLPDVRIGKATFGTLLPK